MHTCFRTALASHHKPAIPAYQGRGLRALLRAERRDRAPRRPRRALHRQRRRPVHPAALALSRNPMARTSRGAALIAHRPGNRIYHLLARGATRPSTAKDWSDHVSARECLPRRRSPGSATIAGPGKQPRSAVLSARRFCPEAEASRTPARASQMAPMRGSRALGPAGGLESDALSACRDRRRPESVVGASERLTGIRPVTTCESADRRTVCVDCSSPVDANSVASRVKHCPRDPLWVREPQLVAARAFHKPE